jgi:hypothetical protein
VGASDCARRAIEDPQEAAVCRVELFAPETPNTRTEIIDQLGAVGCILFGHRLWVDAPMFTARTVASTASTSRFWSMPCKNF